MRNTSGLGRVETKRGTSDSSRRRTGAGRLGGAAVVVAAKRYGGNVVLVVMNGKQLQILVVVQKSVDALNVELKS